MTIPAVSAYDRIDSARSLIGKGLALGARLALDCALELNCAVAGESLDYAYAPPRA